MRFYRGGWMGDDAFRAAVEQDERAVRAKVEPCCDVVCAKARAEVLPWDRPHTDPATCAGCGSPLTGPGFRFNADRSAAR